MAKGFNAEGFNVYGVEINVPEQTKILWDKFMANLGPGDWDEFPLYVQGLLQRGFESGVACGMRVALDAVAAADKTQRLEVADRN